MSKVTINFNDGSYGIVDALLTAEEAFAAYQSGRHVFDLRLMEYPERFRFEQMMRDDRALAKGSTQQSVYVLRLISQDLFKIGCSASVNSRLKKLKTVGPFRTQVVSITPVQDHYATESAAHRMFAAKRVSGEWFSLDTDDLRKLDQFLASQKVQ